MPIDPCSDGCLNHNLEAPTGPGAGDDPCNNNGNGYFCAGSYWAYDPTAPGADIGTYGDCPRLWIRNGGDCNVDQWVEIALAGLISDVVAPVNGVDCCPPGTVWCVPAGTAGSTVNQIWISTNGCGTCTWCQICGHAVGSLSWNEIVAGPLVVPENTIITPGHTQINEDNLGDQGPGAGQFTIPRTGCYQFSGFAVTNYFGLPFVSGIIRYWLVVNGAIRTLIGVGHMMNQAGPMALGINMNVNGSTIECLNAGDVVEGGFEFITNIGGQVINVSQTDFRFHEVKA